MEEVTLTIQEEVPQWLAVMDNHIEALWVYRQVTKSLDDREIELTDHQLRALVEQLYDNHESIDQDIDFRIDDFLKEVFKNG